MPVRSRLIVSNLGAAWDAARAGIGITEGFSYLVADSIKSGELIPLLQAFQPPPIPVSFVYSLKSIQAEQKRRLGLPNE